MVDLAGAVTSVMSAISSDPAGEDVRVGTGAGPTLAPARARLTSVETRGYAHGGPSAREGAA